MEDVKVERGLRHDMRALDRWLDTWGPALHRSRHDYDCPDHRLAEMLYDGYFGTLTRISAGDILYVTDCVGDRATFLIDEVIPKERRVLFTILEQVKPTIITRRDWVTQYYGLTVRFRGVRGGSFCVVNEHGHVLAGNYEDRKDAEAMLKQMSSHGSINTDVVPPEHRMNEK